MTTGTEIATINRAGEELDRLSTEAQALSIFDGGRFSTALAAARMMNQIDAALDAPGVADAIMPLIGSAIGVRTDRDSDRSKSPYTWREVKPAVIEATMRGVPMVGNCWNLIASRCYVTKEGFGLLLKQYKGLRYSIICDVPRLTPDKGAIVDARIRWSLAGEEHDETVSFAVRLNAGMGADAAVGKATRKARAWLYGTITGSETPEGEAEDTINVTAQGSDEPAKGPGTLRKPRTPAPPPVEAPAPETPKPAPSGPPPLFIQVQAALERVKVPEEQATAFLRTTGNVPAGKGLAACDEKTLTFIFEHPEDFKADVNIWSDTAK